MISDILSVPARDLLDRLNSDRPLLTAELRPPRRDLDELDAMDAWIDTYQAVRRLSRLDTLALLTDNAVGASEEENLSHLVRNLGDSKLHAKVLPFLTLKHPLEYCLRFAARAYEEGFPGIVVLGGDPQDEAPRCFPRSWQLRERLQQEQPALLYGGWANPFRKPAEQVGYLAEHGAGLAFVLMQIASHHNAEAVEAFVRRYEAEGPDVPLIGGVFFYRSARARTLSLLSQFMPVPVEGLERDFAAGQLPLEVAIDTVRALRDAGLSRFYVSNIEPRQAPRVLESIAEAAGMPSLIPDS